jgi:glycine cleavage system aminomethyltransferase T
VNLDIEADFIGKAALRRIRDQGVSRIQVGVIIDGAPMKGPNTIFWAITRDGTEIGKVTLVVYSHRLERNIALAMVAVAHAPVGTEVDIMTPSGSARATVVERPFYDPQKKLAAA